MRKKKNIIIDCYDCYYRNLIHGNCHSLCSNFNAKVTGDEYGIRKGWFFWPFNFDPVWLNSCDGFKSKSYLRKE